MKKLTKTATLATALATVFTATLMTGAATAQDSDKKFDGMYFGAELGLDRLKFEGEKEDDFYYGGVLGFRNQMDSGLVFGLEGTFGDSKTNLGSLAKTDHEWSTALTLGWTLGENTLLYSKAGYAQLKGTYTDNLGNSFSDNDGGLRLGAGFEQALSQNISFRAGVDYTTYGGGLKQWQGKTGLLFKF